jgi:hypothetical protein
MVGAVSLAWWLHDVNMWSRASTYFATYAVVFIIDVVGTIKGVFGAKLMARNIVLYSLSSLVFNTLGGVIFVSLTNATGTILSLLIAQSVVFPIRYLVARRILNSQKGL